jgi:hypothetical protein
MACRNNKLFFILLFAPVIFFFSNTLAQAQACKQVVYLFRHAEDVDDVFPTQLTPAGVAHAALYQMMIEQLETAFTPNLCAVNRVFAMWDRDGAGTTNPYNTALPLAQKVTGSNPEMVINFTDGNTYYLCETTSPDNLCNRPGRNALDGVLRAYLSLYLQTNPEVSVAIFYTRQGMPYVSGALGVPSIPVTDPGNDGADGLARSWPGLLRSSVNIFDFNGTDFSKRYNNPAKIINVTPMQCFSFSRDETQYACQSSRGGLQKIPERGVMCTEVTSQRGSDFYGKCAGPSASPHDIDANMVSDIIWRDTSGDIAVWLMSAAGVASSGALGNVPTTWSLVGQRDFDGNGTADLLWRDSGGNTAIWFMNGSAVTSSTSVGNISTNFTVVATGDFNGDGMGDILWQDASGNLAMWLMNGATVSSTAGLGTVPVTVSIAQTGDFNGDGKSDLLWRDTSGNTAVWFMNGMTVASTVSLGNVPTNWTVQSVNAD